MLLRSLFFILGLQILSCSNQATESTVNVKTSRCAESMSFQIDNLTKKSSSEILSEAASRDYADYQAISFFLDHMSYFSGDLKLDRVASSNCYYVETEPNVAKELSAKLVGTNANPLLVISYGIKYPNQQLAYEIKIKAKQEEVPSKSNYEFNGQWAAIFAHGSVENWDETFSRPIYLGGGEVVISANDGIK